MHELRERHLAIQIARQPEDADQRGGRTPVARLRAGQLELDGQELWLRIHQVYIRIDAAREGGEDLLPTWVVARELEVQVAAIQEQAGRRVLLNEAPSEGPRP